ncbi:Gfo/Idh/MocA family protein [Paenibacillus xerothermodurans]|uniref:Gfo/Idh/MocA family oxidoreductase n=1 Tax=Paenibacillus xerothermodurans TaxID=1977292 RepID=A0A2W1N918_PAEXE|nr:Gfo/Idh/MocA family oxidoreductase [Paenibacillus xerothermodurans]PZE21129.1 gfo/Idh/MocA family oxidoreductase [Paenibacillus xerothermodurans]
MRVGVIGTGVMGGNHVRAYASLKDRCTLVGIYDINYERASQIAQQYGTAAFHSLEDLLQNVDAVSITVPTSSHFSVGSQCLDYRVHILVEKPITDTIDNAKKLIQKAAMAQVVLQAGHIELFNPTIRTLKSILSSEQVIAFDIHRMGPLEPRNKKLDVVQDLMIHDIYILPYLLGEQVDQIYALGWSYDNVRKHVSALLRFKSGVVGQLTASQVTEEKVRTVRVITRDAFIQANLLDSKILISRSTNFFMKQASAGYIQQNIVEKVVVPAEEPLRMQLIHFIDCIKKKTKPMVSGEDGLEALIMTEKIRRVLRNVERKVNHG